MRFAAHGAPHVMGLTGPGPRHRAGHWSLTIASSCGRAWAAAPARGSRTGASQRPCRGGGQRGVRRTLTAVIDSSDQRPEPAVGIREVGRPV